MKNLAASVHARLAQRRARTGEDYNVLLVRFTLDQLPESMFAVIQLVYYQGLKYREAADVLNIPVGTVKSRVHAAIAKLGEVWNTHQVD